MPEGSWGPEWDALILSTTYIKACRLLLRCSVNFLTPNPSSLDGRPVHRPNPQWNLACVSIKVLRAPLSCQLDHSLPYQPESSGLREKFWASSMLMKRRCDKFRVLVCMVPARGSTTLSSSTYASRDLMSVASQEGTPEPPVLRRRRMVCRRPQASKWRAIMSVERTWVANGLGYF